MQLVFNMYEVDKHVTYWNCGMDSSCFSISSLPSCMSILRHPPDRCWCIGPCIENVSACPHMSALLVCPAYCTDHLGDKRLGCEAALDVFLCEHILRLLEPGSGGIEVGVTYRRCMSWTRRVCIESTYQSRCGCGGLSSMLAGQSPLPLRCLRHACPGGGGGGAGEVGVVFGGALRRGSWTAALLCAEGRMGLCPAGIAAWVA